MKKEEKKHSYIQVTETPEDTLASILSGLNYLEMEAEKAGFFRLSNTIKSVKERWIDSEGCNNY